MISFSIAGGASCRDRSVHRWRLSPINFERAGFRLVVPPQVRWWKGKGLCGVWRHLSLLAVGVGGIGLRAPVVMVLLRNDKMLHTVEALVNDSFVVVGPDWEVFGTPVPSFDTREVVGLVNEPAALVTAISLHAVTARRALPGWTSKKLLVDRACVRGVAEA